MRRRSRRGRRRRRACRWRRPPGRAGEPARRRAPRPAAPGRCRSRAPREAGRPCGPRRWRDRCAAGPRCRRSCRRRRWPRRRRRRRPHSGPRGRGCRRRGPWARTAGRAPGAPAARAPRRRRRPRRTRGPGSPRRELHSPGQVRNRILGLYGGTTAEGNVPLAYFQGKVNSYPMADTGVPQRHGSRTVGVLGASAYGALAFSSTEEALDKGTDVLFMALPHGQAATLATRALAGAGLVVDLSADFRLHRPDDYPAWYGGPHPLPAELGSWPYGLPELHRSELLGATKVAVPGCYPTAALLALAPLVAAGLVEADGIVIDAKSGISGAGRSLKDAYLFVQA